ncbi:hypothetical protein [Methylomagnum sp.]
MSKFPSRFSALALAVVACCQMGQASAAAPTYSVTWLGFLDAGDTMSYARDINASGQVVGSSELPPPSNGYNGKTRGFLWTQQSGMTSLGQFPECAAQPCYSSDANGNTWNDNVIPWAIGATGSVVGDANGPGGYEHAFLYSAASGMTAPLGVPVGRNNGASGINGLGDLVGHMGGDWATGTSGLEVGYLYKADGTLLTLPVIGGSAAMYAYDINDAGLIVGGSSYQMPPDGINPPGTITYGYRPTLWEKGQNGQYSGRVLPGFGTATGWNFAHSVNASGQVVGYMQLPDDYHAFLYNNGTVTDLGCGMAEDINAAGTVVGGDASAFMYYQGARYDLNALVTNKAAADSIAYASGINDSGWIAGAGIHNGKTEAFVLIPDGGASTAQPSAPCPGTTPPPPPPQGADLSVTLTDAPDPVAVGATLTYTITVVNNGADTAAAVNVSDVLPANVAFSSSTASQGGCAGGASVSCDLGDLASGATATIQIAVQPTAGGTLSNTASASSSTTELNPADNSATATTTVSTPTGGTGSADLAVSVVDEPDPVVAGGELVYIVKVRNKSAVAASGVVLTMKLPAGVSLPEISGATCTGTGTLTCNLGTVKAKGSKEVEFMVVTQAAGILKGSATVTSATTDPIPANNTASATTTVQ